MQAGEIMAPLTFLAVFILLTIGAVVALRGAVAAQGRRLWIVALLPLISVGELTLGLTHRAAPPAFAPAWVSQLVLAGFLANIVLSLVAVIWLKGARGFAASAAGANLLLNFLITLAAGFALAGTGF